MQNDPPVESRYENDACIYQHHNGFNVYCMYNYQILLNAYNIYNLFIEWAVWISQIAQVSEWRIDISKLLLIDGHSILNRAFYGIPDLTNNEGIHTNAMYGFLNIMFRFID